MITPCLTERIAQLKEAESAATDRGYNLCSSFARGIVHDVERMLASGELRQLAPGQSAANWIPVKKKRWKKPDSSTRVLVKMKLKRVGVFVFVLWYTRMTNIEGWFWTHGNPQDEKNRVKDREYTVLAWAHLPE